jgi:hypothetical protein
MAAMIAAKRAFRSRTFSTPTPVNNNQRAQITEDLWFFPILPGKAFQSVPRSVTCLSGGFELRMALSHRSGKICGFPSTISGYASSNLVPGCFFRD